jgi:hypothetical protein
LAKLHRIDERSFPERIVAETGIDRVAVARRRASRLRPDLKLEELARTWAAARKPAPKSLAGASRAVAQFIALNGDLPVAEFVADDLFDYRDALSTLPRALSRRERALDFTALIARFADCADSRIRLSVGTVRKQLRYIQGLLTFAFRERWIEDNVGRDIPAVGMADRAQRRSFTREEAHAVFALPLFVAPWSRAGRGQISADTLRW